MKGLVVFLWWVTWNRAKVSWRLLLASFAAVLLATTVVAASSLYSSTLAQRGLRYTLSAAPQHTLNLQVIVQERPLARPQYRKVQAAVDRSVTQRLGGLLLRQNRYGKTSNFPLLESWDGRFVSRNLVSYAFFSEEFEGHARLVQGRWPSPTPILQDGHILLEFAVGREATRSTRWTLGQEFRYRPFLDSPDDFILLKLVGLMVPQDPEEEFWLGDTSHFRLQDPDGAIIAPFYVNEEAFFEGLAKQYPSLLGSFWWRLFVTTNPVTTGGIDNALKSIKSLETDLNKSFPPSLVLTNLDTQLRGYNRNLALSRVPISLFSAMVVGVLLYYLAMVNGLVAHSRETELALLRSRGASRLQAIALVGVAEGALLALPAVLLGPFLAFSLLRYPLSSALTSGLAGETLPSLSLRIFGWSALVGFLSVLVLGISSFGVVRASVVEFLRQRARPPTIPLLHRYYLDIFLIVLVGVLWWQLRGRGGFVTAKLFGEGLEVSPVVLWGPGLGLVTASLVLLRLFPLVMRVLARFAQLFRWIWLVHGAQHIAREAKLYGGLALLLTLTVGLGIFGAIFSATLLRAQQDQTRYRIGAQVVVALPPTGEPAVDAARYDRMAFTEGVASISPVFRTDGSLLGGAAPGPIKLLAVNPQTFANAAWFRGDFADTKGVSALLDPLRTPTTPQQALPFPQGTERLGVWVRPGKPIAGLNLWAHGLDVNGEPFDVFLGELNKEGWYYVEGQMRARARNVEPSVLTSLFLTTGLRGGIGAGSVAVDNITALTTDGTSQVLESFERPTSWQPLSSQGSSPDTVRSTYSPVQGGTGALEFVWTTPPRDEPRGIILPVVPIPLPAIASGSLPPGQRLLLSVKRQLLPVGVQKISRYFPSLDPTEGPYVILNLQHYLEYLRSIPLGSQEEVEEYWLGLEVGLDHAETVGKLRAALPASASIRDSEAELQKAEENPLAAAGWRSLVLIGVMALVGIALLGFVLFAAVAIQGGRTELAVIQALGFSPGQLFLLLAFEYAVVTVIGLASGAALGWGIGRWALSYLDIRAGGRAGVPPIVLAMDGDLAGVALVGGVLAAGVTVVLALVLAWRLKLPEVLRGEE